MYSRSGSVAVVFVAFLFGLVLAVSTARAEVADPGRPSMDLFKPLVEERVAPPPETSTPGPKAHPAGCRCAICYVPPVIPPVVFRVVGIAEHESQQVAVIEFDGQVFIVTPGQQVPSATNPAFEVRSVTPRSVVVYDRRAGRSIERALLTDDAAGN